MGKKKICSKCNTEFNDSRKQKLERAGIMKALKGIKVAGIQSQDKETKQFCFSCWKVEMRSMMKPYAQALGKTAKKW